MPTFRNAYHFRDVLTQRRFWQIGSGFYGAVLAPKSGGQRVLKVCQDPDDGWPHYAAFAAANWKRNRHFLRVFNIHAVRGVSYAYFASMERLERRESVDTPPEVLRTIGQAVYAASFLKRSIRHSELGGFFSYKDYLPFNDLFESGHHELALALFEIGVRAEQLGANLDLHDANFMWRKATQEVVITDPYCHPMENSRAYSSLTCKGSNIRMAA